ncbi:RrF2 family transcriptional regulator [Carboxylicivirga sp. N1Y90]|uniref:RrF2 family transcriptional regulator n=1 Tax=Carboxylicivirga fragile TaxID=3417571 RepID=UPI003D33FDAD|nr:Rrf2 family transcriptional regulator [Marinilabiliaceae bacterium N1Y90]
MFPKKVYYGLRFVLALSLLKENSHLGVAELAEKEELPVKFLEAIAVALRKNGIINVKRGAGGGYFLARSLGEIKLYDIVLILDEKMEKEISTSGVNSEKAVGLFMNTVKADYIKLLKNYSLEDLMSHYSDDNERIMYYI